MSNLSNTGSGEVGDLDNLGLTVELLELGNNGVLEIDIGNTHVGDRRSHTWSTQSVDVWVGGRSQVLPDYRNVWRGERQVPW